MSRYGDALLKAMTFDVLSELFGKDNFKVITNITPYAISNAFYEQIFLHYDLHKLTPSIGPISYEAKSSKGTTHRRGDILEAYMAAIEKDISRNGQGYQEVRDWLLKVLALRLRKVVVREESGEFHSTGTAHQSFTVIPPKRPPSLYPRVQIIEPTTSVFTSAPPLPADTKTIESPFQATGILCGGKTSQVIAQPNMSLTGHGPLRDESSITNIQLHKFRHFIFESMKQILQESHKRSRSSTENVKSFWSALRCRFDGIQSMVDGEQELILLFYYRVFSCSYSLTLKSYVYLQLNDSRSAIVDLRSVLSFKSSLFDSRIHEHAVKRLLSTQSEISMTIITYDINYKSGVCVFSSLSLMIL